VKIDLRILGVLCLVGIGLMIAGLIIGTPTLGLEGGYFNRSIGPPAFSGVVARSGNGLLDPSDGNLWIGAGLAILGATAVALLVARGHSKGTADTSAATMPAVIGMSLTAGTAKIASAGGPPAARITTRTVPSPLPAGTIVLESPVIGAPIGPGTQVTLNVSDGTEPRKRRGAVIT